MKFLHVSCCYPSLNLVAGKRETITKFGCLKKYHRVRLTGAFLHFHPAPLLLYFHSAWGTSTSEERKLRYPASNISGLVPLNSMNYSCGWLQNRALRIQGARVNRGDEQKRGRQTVTGNNPALTGMGKIN